MFTALILTIGFANNLLQASQYNAEMGWLGKRYLYRKLVANPALMPSGSVFETFHNATYAGNIGSFHSVEVGVANVFAVDATTGTQLTANYTALSADMEEVGVIDSLLHHGSNNPGLPQQRADVLVTLGALAQSNTTLMDGALAQQITEADAVNTQNGAIATANLYESNDKLVNTIFLNTVAKGILAFDANQKASLLAVANQCPYAGGTAVFKARGLLAITDNLSFDDDVLCTSGQPLMQPPLGNTQVGFELFPNPAKQEVVISFMEETKVEAYLTIFDALGKEVIRQTIPANSQLIVLDVSSLQNGLYLCSLFENHGEVASRKLMIAK